MYDGAENDQKMMDIVSRALRQPPTERDSYLRVACQNDQMLYRETMEAVKWEERMGSFLQHPPISAGGSSRPFEVGQVISERFEIQREIGEGGMGIVYLAFDRKRKQRIAIKSAKPGFHRLLSPELEGALRVRHPNVCLVNEIHTTQTSQGEIDFLTMELLEGETLAARLAAHGKLPQIEALQIARQLCAGLSEAHRSDVLHRDFKSANIILCANPEGMRAVITDFGLACGSGQTGEEGGTPQYMAPELWRGEKASKASDIYSLGVVLYEMVAGRPPFAADADRLTTVPPAPGTLTPGLRPQWDRMILQCLRPAPADRPGDAAVVLAGLNQRPVRKLPFIVLALAILVLLALPQVRSRLRETIWPLPNVRLAVLPMAGQSELAAAGNGILRDVSDRIRRRGGGRRTVVVIPASEVEGHGVGTPAQAKQILHATHVVQAAVHREGDEILVDEAVIDLDTGAHVRDFSGRYVNATVGTMPEALAATVSLALRLPGAPSPEVLSAAATVPYDRGLYLLHKDDQSFEDAIVLFGEAARLDPRSPLPMAALAEAQIQKFQATKNHDAFADAQSSLHAAESLSPDSVRVRLVAGLLNQTAGRYEKALDEYRHVQELEPRNVDALLHIASVYFALDMNNEAIAMYQRAIELDPGYYEPYRKLGEFYYFRSRSTEAAEQLQKAIDRAPGLFDIYSELGGVLSDLGRNEEAERALLASINLRETADARNSLGAIRAYEKRDQEAVGFYERALALNPLEYVYWLNLGDSDRRLGSRRNAAVAYRKGMGLALTDLKNNPRDGYSRAFVAYFSARLGDRTRAEDEITQALELSPGDTKVVRRAVLTYEALGQRDRAMEMLKGASPEMLSDLDRQPDLADFRQDSRFKQVVDQNKNGGK